MALSKKNRLKKRKEFDDIFRNGRTSKGRFLLVKSSKEINPTPKIGFVISAKVAKKAVDRNRVRRILADEAQKNIAKVKSNTIVLVLKLPIPKETEREVFSKEINTLLIK